MPTTYVIRDKNGKALDRISANSRQEAVKSYKAKKPNIPGATLDDKPTMAGKALDWALHEYAPDIKVNTGNKALDFVGQTAYDYGVKPMTSPLGIATAPWMGLKALPIAVKAGIKGFAAPAAKTALKSTDKKYWLRRIVEETKGLSLTSGLPGTNISMHGVSTAAMKALATPWREGGLPVGAYRAMKNLIDQPGVEKRLAAIAAKPFSVMGKQRFKYIPDPARPGKTLKVPLTLEDAARRYGVTMDTATAGGRMTEPLLTAGKYNPAGRGRQVLEEIFDKPLFEKKIKLEKLEVFERNVKFLEEQMLKGKMGPIGKKEWAMKVGRQASKDTAYFFGGLGKHSTWDKHSFSNMVLAPDWYERHTKLGSNVAKSLGWQNPLKNKGKFFNPAQLKDPGYAAYRTVAGNGLAAMVAIDQANRALSGHSMWDNAPGKFFLIDSGRVDSTGKRAYIDPTGGAFDFARIPIDVAHAMNGGDLLAVTDVIRNRLSTVLRFGAEITGALPYKPAANRLQYTKRERQPDGSIKWVRRPEVAKQAEFFMEDVIDNFTPGFVQAAEDLIHKGDRDQPQSKESAISQAFELPLRFGKDPRPETMSRAAYSRMVREQSAERRKKRTAETLKRLQEQRKKGR